MTTQHTQVPWHIEPLQADQGESIAVCAAGIGVVAVISPDEDGTFTREIDEANAAFIVKAVNAHDQLVAALKMAEAYISTRAPQHPVTPGEIEAANALTSVITTLAAAGAT